MINLAFDIQSRVWRFLGRTRYVILERHYNHTIRVGIVLTTVLLTSLTAAVLMRKETLGLILLAGVAGLVALVFVYHYLEYGPFVLIVISTVINPKLPNDLTLTLICLMALLALWFFKLLVVERSFSSVRPALFNKFALLFIVAVVISYVWSSFYVDPDVRYFQESKFLPRTLTGLVLIFSPLAALLYANLLRSERGIKRLVWYYIVFGAVVALPRAMELEFLPFINIEGQLPAWASLLALGQVLFNSNVKRWQRYIMVVVIGLWLYIQIGLGITWLSGWIPLMGGIAIVVFLRSRLAFLLIILLVAAYVISNSDLVNKILADEQQESGYTRAEAGNLTLEIANQHFLFGTGPTGYYFYMMTRLDPRSRFQLSHNNYVDIYAQTGIVGFAAWVMMWLSAGWIIIKTYFASPPGGFVKGLAGSLVGMYCITLVLMMLGDWVTPFTYTQSLGGISYTIWPWAWAGTGIALYHLVRQQHAPDATDPNRPARESA